MLKIGRGAKYKIVIGDDFKKGFKRMKNRKRPMSDLRKIIDILASGEDLSAQFKPHPLKDELYGYWACQVGKNADWRLIYRVDHKNQTLYLADTGTHDEVYKKN